MKFVIAVTILISSLAASAQKLGCNTSRVHLSLFGESTVSYVSTAWTRGGIVTKEYFWRPGTTIKVNFLSGSQALQERVKSIAKIWEGSANIQFEFVQPTDEAEVRIYLGTGDGHYSYVGRSATYVSQKWNTMSIDTADLGASIEAWRSVVLHQFGHALGLQHERSTPENGISWDRTAMIEHYKKFEFTPEDVETEIFSELNLSHSNGTSYDPKSIMTYPIFKWQTTNGYQIPWSGSLSESDKKMIAGIYPGSDARKEKAEAKINDTEIKMTILQNQLKGGLSFYPSVEVEGNGATTKIYICVLLYDENGNPLQDEDRNYAFDNTVAAGRTTNLIAGSRLTANKEKERNYELFLPFSEIPLKTGQTNVKVKLIVIQENGNDYKTLRETDAVSYSLVANTDNKAIPTSVTFPAPKKG